MQPLSELNSLLEEAVKNGDIAVVKDNLAKGADPNCFYGYMMDTPLILTVLAEYSYETKKGIIELLIDYGADINLGSVYGLTPLHKAVYKKDERVVSLLLDNGADINGRNHRGDTPLHSAIYARYYFDQTDMIGLLMERGADSSIKDNFGETPLSFARDNKALRITDIIKAHDNKKLEAKIAAVKAEEQRLSDMKEKKFELLRQRARKYGSSLRSKR